MLSQWHLPMIVGASLSLLSAIGAQAQDAQLPVVTVAKPVVRDVIDSDEFIGRFEPVDEVQVRARIGGYLDEVNFTDGALVKKGDKLFVIDQRPYRTALSQAESTLESARSSLEFAEAQFKRTQSLTGTGTLSVSTLDDHRRELLSAQALVRGAEAAVERAKLDLDYTTITAPLSGRVDRRLLSTGNLVQADQTVLTTIVSLDPIDFYFDVDERRLLSYARVARERGSALQEGGGSLEVLVTIADSQEEPFKGKLDFAENRVDPQSGTMRVRARLDNPSLVLQPGLFGRVQIEGSNTYKAVLIPDEAIGADQNERIVYEVTGDGTVVTKPVRLGPKLHGYRVIRSGMTGDETIVVNGLMRARPGTKVKPETVQLPPEAQAAGAAQ
ncbi:MULTISPECIES: efflux RND transporter periplasmic adaptor subunit [Ensifer]|jgi:membrane fusion protein, multidrug efflux system|uniref:Efflux RND transporter periplasmic adaptor subunit n=1 Tax=Ensifer adhaerens TaxID=106592 RepID=A0ABY8HEH7_ENSAD|nr:MULTISPECIES: efflux RND transporter periplasmic adaptor subunit [Ensifer]OWZ92420.1 MexE family multidrug efflux RND transporter periplasmic adaptor subunit [Sinorhizobium sp. LM21]ANK73800.1 efflux transporter periplasmic adaptor subunit [Ensifer adhaerens]KDP70234.1 hemolysin secretion protein D [Ensifer adhaerens]KQX27024.1 hemolysin secretion protein D [Ensifer sp. Root423]KQX55594.1 hemolysin secretion protein D [Ensifer sp. Root1298]